MRDSCLNCVRKHLACSSIYAHEARYGYASHKWLAIGELCHAEQEADRQYPDIAAEINEARKDYEDGLPFDGLRLIGLCSSSEKEEELKSSRGESESIMPELWSEKFLEELTRDDAFYKILKESKSLGAEDTVKIHYNYTDGKGGFVEGPAPDNYDEESGNTPTVSFHDAETDLSLIEQAADALAEQVDQEILEERKEFLKSDPSDQISFYRTLEAMRWNEELGAEEFVKRAKEHLADREEQDTLKRLHSLNPDGAIDWFKENGYKLINFANGGDSKMVQIIHPSGRIVYTGNRYSEAVTAYRMIEDETI